MKHFLFQIFVLFPLALLETGGTVCAAYGICALAGVPFFGEIYYVAEDNLIAFILMAVIGILAMLLIGRLDVKLRELDTDDGVWFWFEYLLSPVRLPLQLIGGIVAFIGIFCDSIEDIADDDSPFQMITYVLFHFAVDADFSGVTRERFGKSNIKSRNILMQIFVMLPIAALQFFMCVLIYKGIENAATVDDWHIFLPILWVIVLFALAIISTKMRGHEAEDEYFEENYGYKPKKMYDGVRDRPTEEKLNERHRRAVEMGVRDYQGMDDFNGYRKIRGGWTSYIRLVTIFCILCSPILVFCQVISILIAIFTNPYYGRIYSWYGEIDYGRCNSVLFQKILHFLFGFVVLAY